MRTIAIAVAILALAACSGAPSPSLPQTQSAPALPGRVSRETPKDGIYVSEFYGSSVFGYAGMNQRNAPPICGETSGDFVADVATDRNGDLIAPSQLDETVKVYSGPRMCGPTAATLKDPYGLPVDVASANALTLQIAVANIEDDGPISNPPPGSITICTVAGGCTKNLTDRRMYRVAGVAVDKGGNCWASAVDKNNEATLTYFRHCSGKGHAATGFQNSNYGGLEFDESGNLIALDSANTRIFIYAGCRPACRLIAGPLALQGKSIYGKLDTKGTTFAAADYQYGRIDLYKYSTTGLSYEFSFSQDLGQGSSVEGVAFSPSL
ncbi:MAG TPA: hypothetical protein VGI19_16820 [Candidatus Cybelea sp.]|jgi:hypothetical protein